MSTTLLEVIEGAGYDIRSNVDDAKWLLEQDLDRLYEMAGELVEEYEEWEDCKDIAEEYGEHKFPDFNEWKGDKNGRNKTDIAGKYWPLCDH